MSAPVSIVVAEPAPVAVVVLRTTFRALPGELQRCLDEVHAAARARSLHVSGPNIAIYRQLGSDGAVEAEIGVHVSAPFEDVGSIRCRHTPSGRAASTLHQGPYEGLPAAHTAILEWARDAGADLAGVSWEVFDHGAGGQDRRTEVFHLLAVEPSVVDYEG